MSLREKIIVSLCIFSVLYGIYYFALPYISFGISRKPGFGEPDMNSFVQKTTAALVQDDEIEMYRFISEQIHADWKNPLFEPEQKVRPKTIGVIPQYTGYVRMGSRRFAIIDGSEYTTGDMMEQNGYEVMDIQPTHVTVKAGRNDFIDIPLIEMNSVNGIMQ